MATKAKNTKAKKSKTAKTKTTSTDTGKSSNDKSKTSSSRGPALYWDAARDLALVEAATSSVNPLTKYDLHDRLSAHEAFKGDTEALTPDKIRDRINKLRHKGVKVPAVARPKGGWRGYSPDVEALNKVVEGETADSDDSGGKGD